MPSVTCGGLQANCPGLQAGEEIISGDGGGLQVLRVFASTVIIYLHLIRHGVTLIFLLSHQALYE